MVSFVVRRGRCSSQTSCLVDLLRTLQLFADYLVAQVQALVADTHSTA